MRDKGAMHSPSANFLVASLSPKGNEFMIDVIVNLQSKTNVNVAEVFIVSVPLPIMLMSLSEAFSSL